MLPPVMYQQQFPPAMYQHMPPPAPPFMQQIQPGGTLWPNGQQQQQQMYAVNSKH
jgi:hypothetical protein